MDSSYLMGTRLIIRNANMEKTPAGFAFAEVAPELRTHKDSTVVFDEIAEADIASGSFIDIEGNQGDTGTFIQYYPGSLTCAEALENYLILKQPEPLVTLDLLSMQFELMTYSQSARVGNVITFELYQTNSGLFRTNIETRMFQPFNNGATTAATPILIAI